MGGDDAMTDPAEVLCLLELKEMDHETECSVLFRSEKDPSSTDFKINDGENPRTWQ